MADLGRSWCPSCRHWVPPEKMHRYYDGGKLVRVCDWCLEGVATPEKYVYDPHFGAVQCIYCDSYNTEPVGGDSNAWKCRDCGEVSYLVP